jgi:sortase A
MTRRPRYRWMLRAALLAAFIGGAGVALDGLWMPAKAALGQALLATTWTTGAAEPWPGADMKAIARLSVPSLDQTAYVLDSASGKAMAWGPGHVPGTPLPGDPGLSAIGGHRDSHLSFLGETKPGDRILVERPAIGQQGFTVTHAEVVDSRTWRYPVDHDGPPRLALTTCWPLDAQTQGPMRLVIYAQAFTE